MLQRLNAALAGASKSTQAMIGLGVVVVLSTGAAAVGRPQPALLAGVYIAVFFALFALSLRKLRFDYLTIAIVFGGFVLYLGYLTYTTYSERNYDGPAQLEYITYIVQHKSLPPVTYCFICHHPPVYYVLAAAAYLFFQKTRLANPELGLQLFSLLIFAFFITFGLLTLRRFTTDSRRLRLGAALMVFWPYSVHNSCRVHNDSLVSLWMVMTLYFIVCWYQDEKPRDLYWGAVFAALGVMTKSSAFIMVALLLIVLGLRFFVSQDRLRYLRRSLVVLGIVGTALFLNTLGKGHAPSKQVSPDGVVDRTGQFCQKILGTACDIGPQQWVQNEPVNYFYFEVTSFLKEPYVICDRDDTGRQYFWNHLFKSSLFGTHNSVADKETAYELNWRVASVMTFLQFGMMLYMAVALLFVKKKDARRHVVMWLCLGLIIAFMMGFRILIPAPHHTDFRHAFPALVIVTMFYVNAVGRFREKGSVLEWVGYALAVPFMALSIFYFLPKYDWAMRVTARVVEKDLAAYSEVVPEGSAWDRKQNLFIEGNWTVEFKVNPRKTVSEIDTTVDNNDTYEVVLYGAKDKRTFDLGPQPRKGLVRYVQKVDPPLEGVSKVTLRPVGGDKAYSMGHFILR